MSKKVSLFLLILIVIFAVAATISVTRYGDSSLPNTKSRTAEIPVDSQLKNRIDTFMKHTPPAGIAGLEIYDITAGKEVFSYNKDSLLTPASCMKILTCVAALRYIGAKQQLHNRLYTTGSMRGDTLVGNLVLKTDYDTFFNRDTLNLLIDTLKNHGINHIKGDIVLDMMFTEQMGHEEHWIIGDLRMRYMGLVLQGFPRMQKEILASLRMKGISHLGGGIIYGKANPAQATLIAENVGSMHKLIEKALKVSSNINAEALLYPLGYIIDKRGNYRENGRRLLRNFIRNEIAIEPDMVCRIDDGCGLCPNDKITADLLVKILIYASQHPAIYDEVVADMPLSGVDGTLFKRMLEIDIRGMLRGKTGTLTRNGGVSSLAGFFFGKDGHLMAYAILNNEWGVEDGRAWQDNFCRKALKPQSLIGEVPLEQ